MVYAQAMVAGKSKLKTVDPGEFAAQPPLAPPAGYICVLRDVDSDRWRIEGARHPQALVEDILAECESRFGIEIVSILETEDLAASAATLYERHHAELSQVWLALDDYQVETLRRSMLQIDARPSRYLTPHAPAAAEKATAVKKGSARAGLTGRRRADRWGIAPGDSPRQPLYRLYGAKSLKDYREPEPGSRRRDPDSPERWLLDRSKRVGRFLNSCSGKTAQAVLILLLAALLCVIDSCS